MFGQSEFCKAEVDTAGTAKRQNSSFRMKITAVKKT